MAKESKKEWQEYLYIDKKLYQLDWGDHPRTGDWKRSWTVFSKQTGEPVIDRFYSSKIDAKRGAAMIYRNIKRTLLDDE